MERLLLLRHTEPLDTGDPDPDLSPEGEAQAIKLAQMIYPPPQLVVATPTRRTTGVANAFKGHFNGSAMYVTTELGAPGTPNSLEDLAPLLRRPESIDEKALSKIRQALQLMARTFHDLTQEDADHGVAVVHGSVITLLGILATKPDAALQEILRAFMQLRENHPVPYGAGLEFVRQSDGRMGLSPRNNPYFNPLEHVR